MNFSKRKKPLAFTLNERIIKHMGGNNANHRASRSLELEENKMPTIQIKKTDLIGCLQEALGYANSTDWDVYLRADGMLSIRHTTYDNRDWYEIIDLYSADLENDGKYPGDDGYDYRGSAEWIVSDCGGWLPDSVAFWGDDGEIEHAIELID